MRRASRACAALVVLAGLAFPCRGASGPVPAEIIPRLADRLVDRQVQAGAMKGSWTGEEVFSAAIACGLISAYGMTCDPRYRDAAELAAAYFVNAAEGNFLGDEAYSLTRLGETIGAGAGQRYLQTVQVFYADVKQYAAGSTAGYISGYAQVEPSTAVFYLAHHAVAAHRAGAKDEHIWRRALADYLARIDDASATYPVTALGIATWALAETGPLDDSPVSMSPAGVAYWRGRTLGDLSGLLISHQVGMKGPLPGSFYWRFDHGDGGSGGPESGYTEDLVFAALGLVAAREAEPAPDSTLIAALDAARRVLLETLDGAATVRQHLWLPGGDHLLFSGEVLMSLAALVSHSDLDLDGAVNMVDFTALAARWQASGCLGGCPCGRADLSRDAKVDWPDLALMAGEWLD